MIITRRFGTTRTCYLVGRWAIKVPTLVEWELFVRGILANLKERQFSRCGFPYLAPVLWTSWGGIVLVMPRVDVKREYDEDRFRYLDQWAVQLESLSPGERGVYETLVEIKIDSVGWYRDRVVAVDYGS